MMFKLKSKQLKINRLFLLLAATAVFFLVYSFSSNNFVGAVSPLERCERNDIENTQKCKREYRDCNRNHRNDNQRRDQCKEKAIRDNKKSDGQAGLGCQTQAGSNQCRPSGGGGGGAANGQYAGKHLCGNIRDEDGDLSDDNYLTKFNFGCVGEKGPPGLNPIEDLAFAVLRFLSIGVGIAVVLAIVGSGIQYTMSEGNAEVTSKAKRRIRAAVIGLGLYIFAFSLFQYLVPGGIFRPGDWLNAELITRLL